MGVLSRLIENRSTLAQPDAFLSRWFSGGLDDIYTGKDVNHRTALTYSAWAAAVLLISEVMGSLPLHVYRRGQSGGRETRELMREHPLNELFSVAANPELTAMDWRGLIESHLLSDGNHYSQIIRDGGGRIREFWPLEPTQMRVFRGDDRRLRYLYETDGRRVALPQDSVFHVRMLSRDGVKGIAPLELARQAIGVGLAVEEYAGRFFSNGSTVRGTLQMEGALTDEGFQRLKRDWNTVYQGQENAHKVAILEHGLKFQPVSANPKDSQMLDLRNHQIVEIARIARIPPHLLQQLDRATFNNIEELGIGFVKYSLVHRCARFEQEAARQLFSAQERTAGIYSKHNLKGLLRGDTKTQTEFYRTIFDLGGFAPNDIRELEDLNPIEGGDIYTMQQARATLEQIATGETLGGGQSPSGPPPDDEPDDQPAEENARAERRKIGEDSRIALRESYRPLIESAARRLVNVDVSRVRSQGVKELRSVGSFTIWLEQHREFLAAEAVSRMAEVFASYGAAIASAIAIELSHGLPQERIDESVDALLSSFAVSYAEASVGQLQGVLRQADEAGEDPAAAVEKRLTEWQDKRAGKVAERESTFAGGALAMTIYGALGVGGFRWRTVGKTCALCNSMSGRIVRSGEPFLAAGDTLGAAGVSPLKPRRHIRHPPLHGGCDCIISPG